MVVQTKLTMNNFEICKAMIMLDHEISYTNRFGNGQGKWCVLDQFVHFHGIDTLAVAGVEIQEPTGFGTWASNKYYPSFHHTDEKFAAWKRAVNWYKEQGD